MSMCQNLAVKLGFYCTEVTTPRNEQCTYISTPFALAHGKPLDLYVIERGADVVITDDGFSIAEMLSSGINLTDLRSWKGIADIARRYGYDLEESGAITVRKPSAEADRWLQAAIGLLAELVAWEAERIAAKDTDMSFHDAVETVLRQHKLNKPVTMGANVLLGGRTYDFDFKWGETYVDVVGISRHSVNAKLRKAVEIKLSESDDAPMLFIVDDRADPLRAQEDCKVLTLHSQAVPFTRFKAMANQPIH